MLVNGNFGTVSSESLRAKTPKMFRRFFSRHSVAWSGAPDTPRLKTYTAESGETFHYFYQGHQSSRDSAGTEFAFRISRDQRDCHPLIVLLPDAALRGWQQEHARDLSATERYALVKMTLLQFFDRESASLRLPNTVRVEATDVAGMLNKLDVE
jgi:hypothetical protein